LKISIPSAKKLRWCTIATWSIHIIITQTDRKHFEFGAVTVFVARNIRCLKAINSFSTHCFSGLYDHRRIWKKITITITSQNTMNDTNFQYYIHWINSTVIKIISLTLHSKHDDNYCNQRHKQFQVSRSRH